jgi:hypothetical protein
LQKELISQLHPAFLFFTKELFAYQGPERPGDACTGVGYDACRPGKPMRLEPILGCILLSAAMPCYGVQAANQELKQELLFSPGAENKAK